MRHTSILFARKSERSRPGSAQPHDFKLNPTIHSRQKSNQCLETEPLQPIALEVRHPGLIRPDRLCGD